MPALPIFSIHDKETKLEPILHLAQNQELKRELHKEERVIAADEKRDSKSFDRRRRSGWGKEEELIDLKHLLFSMILSILSRKTTQLIF